MRTREEILTVLNNCVKDSAKFPELINSFNTNLMVELLLDIRDLLANK